MQNVDIPTFQFALREDLKEEKQFLPFRATEFSAGYDVRAAFYDKKDFIVKCGEYVKIPLGIRAAPPEGWWFQLHPRSSTFAKKNLHSLIGIIDFDYSGEVFFAAQLMCDVNNISMQNLTIKYGEPIGQIIPIKLNQMQINEIQNKDFDDLISNRKKLTSRKMGEAGGFGSTNG